MTKGNEMSRQNSTKVDFLTAGALYGEAIVTFFRAAVRDPVDEDSLPLVTLVGVVAKSGILVAVVGKNESFVGEKDVMKSLSSVSSVSTDVSVYFEYLSCSIINNK